MGDRKSNKFVKKHWLKHGRRSDDFLIRQNNSYNGKYRYTFGFDCSHDDHSSGDTKTNNAITFEFYDTDDIQFFTFTPNFSSVFKCEYHWLLGNHWNTVNARLYEDIKFGYVKVKTNGEDALMIDQAFLEKYVGNKEESKVEFGRDDHGAWCLSEDKYDFGGNPKCYKSLNFAYQDGGRGYFKKGKVYP